MDGHVEGHRAVFLTSSAKVRQFGGGGGGSGGGGGGGHPTHPPTLPFHPTILPCLDSVLGAMEWGCRCFSSASNHVSHEHEIKL